MKSDTQAKVDSGQRGFPRILRICTDHHNRRSTYSIKDTSQAS
jgi:hypothetical protein